MSKTDPCPECLTQIHDFMRQDDEHYSLPKWIELTEEERERFLLGRCRCSEWVEHEKDWVFLRELPTQCM